MFHRPIHRCNIAIPCVLIILSLLGQVAPILAREPISVVGGTPAAQLGSQLAEQLAASHLTQPAAPVTAAAESHAGKTASESWLITWEASTDGTGTYEGWTVRRESHVTASIVVNYYADGSSEYYANEYTATYLVDAVATGPCPGGRLLETLATRDHRSDHALLEGDRQRQL